MTPALLYTTCPRLPSRAKLSRVALLPAGQPVGPREGAGAGPRFPRLVSFPALPAGRKRSFLAASLYPPWICGTIVSAHPLTPPARGKRIIATTAINVLMYERTGVRRTSSPSPRWAEGRRQRITATPYYSAGRIRCCKRNRAAACRTPAVPLYHGPVLRGTRGRAGGGALRQ
jgi:hypothetical protein